MTTAAATRPEEASEDPFEGWRHIPVKYLTDEDGTRVGVLLLPEDWELLLDELEELWDTRAYLDAKAEGGEPIPWEEVQARIAELNRCDTERMSVEEACMTTAATTRPDQANQEEESDGWRHIPVKYLTDEDGKRVGVLLLPEDWEHLLDELEELWDTRAYLDGKAAGGGGRPAAEVFADIERERGWTIK